MRPHDWRDDALCAQVDTDAFFPDKGGSPRVAKTICGKCPVREACLEFSIENNITEGVWGGLSGLQRRPLISARHKKEAA